MLFKNKIVIITGAGRGIGKAIANAYCSERATVIIADKNEQEGLETARYLQAGGGEVVSCLTDVSNPEEISKLMLFTTKKFGQIDILINNAGISSSKSLYELGVEEWDSIINTNLRSVFLCSREAAKVMKMNNGGSIVNISSTRALMSEPDSEAYAASKGGIIALTHALAISLSSDNIRVNSISPGWIETKSYDLLTETDHHQHPARRVGKPDDIAKACLYLTSSDNDFITGTNLIIDGGMIRKMFYI